MDNEINRLTILSDMLENKTNLYLDDKIKNNCEYKEIISEQEEYIKQLEDNVKYTVSSQKKLNNIIIQEYK